MSFSRERHRRLRSRPWSASEPQLRACGPSSGRSFRDDLRQHGAIWLRSRGVRLLLSVIRWHLNLAEEFPVHHLQLQ